jgi:hypothetical protein
MNCIICKRDGNMVVYINQKKVIFCEKCFKTYKEGDLSDEEIKIHNSKIKV